MALAFQIQRHDIESTTGSIWLLLRESWVRVERSFSAWWQSVVLACCNIASIVCLVSTLRLALFKHQSAKVLGFVVYFQEIASAVEPLRNFPTTSRGNSSSNPKVWLNCISFWIVLSQDSNVLPSQVLEIIRIESLRTIVTTSLEPTFRTGKKTRLPVGWVVGS